jgi:hypothetical protein
MRAAVRAVGGLRPCFLDAMGLGWSCYGLAIILDAGYARSRGLAGLTRYVPISALGWLWIGAGMVAVVVATVQARRPTRQGPGFAALTVTPALWGLNFARTAIVSHDFSSAGGSAAAWLAFAVGLIIVSGMAEPAWVVEGQGGT